MSEFDFENKNEFGASDSKQEPKLFKDDDSDLHSQGEAKGETPIVDTADVFDDNQCGSTQSTQEEPLNSSDSSQNDYATDNVQNTPPQPPQEPTNAADSCSSGYNSYGGYSQSQQPPSYNNNPYASQQQNYGYPPVNGGFNGYNGGGYNGGGYNNGSTPSQGDDGGNAGKHHTHNKGFKVFLSILIAVVVLGGVGLAVSIFADFGNDSGKNDASTSQTKDDTQLKLLETPSGDNSVAAAEGALTPVQIADKVKPSVVGIIVYANSTGKVASEGSGVLMSEDSGKQYTYVITCAHVINTPDSSISVQLADGKTYDAELVGYDSRTDIGVVKIKATGLKLAEFGSSSALKVGEPIYAIGNPGGREFFGSFTDGLVSAIDRSITSTYTMVCIQHNAAINPGNSGGALVNVFGQVIGINSLKISSAEYEGMGFAIPINDAKTIVDNLISTGYVPDRPKLGISYSSVSTSQQYSMIVQIKGLPAGSLIIMNIDEGSSLANTEARKYDMITAVDGKELTTPDVLLDKIDSSKVGDTITLTLCRVSSNYQISTFDVKVKLVEDRGSSEKEEPTQQNTIDPYEFFNNPFGS